MKHLPLLFIGLTLMTFTSCDFLNPCGANKDEFLVNYNGFIKEIKEKDLAHDASEWGTHDRKFKKMVEECYETHKAEMNASDEVDFWTNALAYYYYRYGTNMIAILNDNSDELSVKIAENVEEFIENPMVVIRKILGKDKTGELDGLMKDLEKDLNKWSKKVEKLFE